jgi:hypothetical protein
MVYEQSIGSLLSRIHGMLPPTEISIHSVQVSTFTSYFLLIATCHGLILLVFFRQPQRKQGMAAVFRHYSMHCRWFRLSTRARRHPHVFTSDNNKHSPKVRDKKILVHLRKINSVCRIPVPTPCSTISEFILV